MQNQTRKIHILRADGNLQATQDQPKTLFMLRLDTGLRAFQEEALKPLVSERPNHMDIVTCNVSGSKRDAQRIIGTSPPWKRHRSAKIEVRMFNRDQEGKS